jgi:hypothetical protein
MVFSSDIVNKSIPRQVLIDRPGSKVWFAPSAPPLERNKHIVHNCGWLIAAPKEDSETLRSGTWATIRYARKLRRPITIVFPNGEVQSTR